MSKPSHKRRSRKQRHQSNRVLKDGPGAKRAHKRIGGRTGSIRRKQTPALTDDDGQPAVAEWDVTRPITGRRCCLCGCPFTVAMHEFTCPRCGGECCGVDDESGDTGERDDG